MATKTSEDNERLIFTDHQRKVKKNGSYGSIGSKAYQQRTAGNYAVDLRGEERVRERDKFGIVKRDALQPVF